jgi:hypothetical protein
MSSWKPTRVLMIAAGIAFLASWLAPVILVTDNVVYRGYRVFWTVLGLLWTPEEFDGWKDGLTFVIYIASALTNLLFVVAVAATLFQWRRLLQGLQWGVLVSAVINLYWLYEMNHLRIGYYLWVAAFFLLFAAMARRSEV